MEEPQGVTVSRTVVTLPAVFEWYQEDFGAAEGDMLHWLAGYLPDAPVRTHKPSPPSLTAPRRSAGRGTNAVVRVSRKPQLK